ncbi:DUF4179 domain-containing protein [Dethiobacter alkaliphilus]|uniref:DUF4179 domain-containing protein n=1 Tax=Dethiobacter alkaliphilus AHT 1 TaxID=555088 RepID=C0GD83_DETAL|nr:DUF4179 domain-containing protein [Dethiobacter alkaliphilus]EEG78604.1 hypothetical protein DealDRAFT_0534 [Dethiobacter alkaliphilus AHT 1]
MKCEEVRFNLIEENITFEITRHLDQCTDCSSFHHMYKKIKTTAIQGINSICPPEIEKTKKRKTKPLIVAASLLLALLVVLPFVSHGIARQLEKIPFLEALFSFDEGLYDGFTRGRDIEYSVSENGIDFTVHRVVAESARTAIFYTIEGELPEDIWFNIPSYRRGGISSIREQDLENGHSGMLQLTEALPPDLEILKLEIKDISNFSNFETDLPLLTAKIPVELIETFENDEYSGLSVENDGLELRADIALGVTGTRIDFQINDWDYIYLKEESRIDASPISLFGETLLPRGITVQLVDRRGHSYRPVSGSAVSQSSYYKGTTIFTPATDRKGLRIRADGFIEESNPLQLNFRKILWRWQTPTIWLHDTLVSVEDLELNDKETVITISYQHGRLADVRDLYVTDSQGNRYRLLNSSLSIPGFDNPFEKDILDLLELMETDWDREYRRLKKYQELRFEPLPKGENAFTLHADTVLFKSTTVLEIPVPTE